MTADETVVETVRAGWTEVATRTANPGTRGGTWVSPSAVRGEVSG